MVQTGLQKDQLRIKLIEKANKQGYITYDDILAMIPDVEKDVALLDDIMEELLEAGVDIVPGGKTEAGDEDGDDDADECSIIRSSTVVALTRQSGT